MRFKERKRSRWLNLKTYIQEINKALYMKT